MDNKPSHFPDLSPLSVATIVIVSVALALVIYHFLVVRCCGRHHRHEFVVSHQQLTPAPSSTTDYRGTPSCLQHSLNELIPSYTFSTDIGSVLKSGDFTCSICLSEFKDGEAIRLLPECLHSFHVPCIDMWLVSHSSCPLCRADTPVHHLAGFRAPNLGNMTGFRSPNLENNVIR
ncbi:hypothetical protein JRO89_XS14G0063600 [Xanthoceras sorbifolium]|uniref:RING-type E3 ubiquitin transferase n=1 Tax=Xanthoceras sorbifolium TaxID=99658 RepID=A0ABQ8H456_9ROSI|nr:hypothetical protein JRO89_XS14G0063600 [Xanthoceras sorbifolium]